MTRRLSAKSDGLVFLGAFLPYDMDSGRLVDRIDDVSEDVRRALIGLMFFDVPEQSVLAQAWQVYTNLSNELAEHGMALSDLVRQRIFLVDLRDLPAVERVMDLMLGAVRPATSIIVMPEAQLAAGLRLQLDAVAAEPGTKAVAAVRLEDSDRYPCAVACRGYIFLSTITSRDDATAVHRDGPSPVVRTREVSLATTREKEICAQTADVLVQMAAILDKLGLDLSDVVKLNGWTGFPMREYGSVVLAREAFFGGPEHRVASTGLAVGGPGVSGRLLSFEGIAVEREAGIPSKEARIAPTGISSPYVVGAVRGRNLVFTSGEVPVDMQTAHPITAVSDLPPDGRRHIVGQLQPVDYQVRAWWVYTKLRQHLAVYGVTFSDVVQQTIYIQHVDRVLEVERIGREMFGSAWPPTTVIPIAGTSPFPVAQLEIDLIAAAHQRAGTQQSGGSEAIRRTGAEE